MNTEQEPIQPQDQHASSRHEEIQRIWMVTKLGVQGLYRSQLPRMAAALAYRTIFSIIPVMAIGLLIFGSVVSEKQVESGVRRVLTFAGISQISAVEAEKNESIEGSDRQEIQPDPKPVELDGIDQRLPDFTLPEADESVGLADESQSQLDGIAIDEANETESTSSSDPLGDADLEQVITDLINRVNHSIRNVPTGWIALTSGLVLLYAAMSMLIEIEKAFNQLCGAPSGRPWLRRIMLYWTILTAGSLLLAATFLAGDAFTRWVVGIAGPDSMVGAVMAGYGVSVLISTLLLLGAYLTIPNTKVHFRSALAGAFFAAVIWELGKLGFTTYLRYTTGYAKFYGSVAILPLFMMWVYLTWLIVLFGMQASFALQNFSRLVESKLALLAGQGDRRSILIDPMIMLHLMKAVYQGFDNGKACSTEHIADLTKLEAMQASELLQVLSEAGLMNQVYSGEELEGWAPAKPASQVLVNDVLAIGYQVDGYRLSRIDQELPNEFQGTREHAFDGMSFDRLISSDDQSDGVKQDRNERLSESVCDESSPDSDLNKGL